MILLVTDKDGRETITNVISISQVSRSATSLTVIAASAKGDEDFGNIDLNKCKVELLPDSI